MWIKRLRNEIRTNINICWHNREFHLFYISMLFFSNWISTLIKKIADYHFVIGILSSIINTNQRCFIFKRSQNILPVKKINLWSNVKEDQLFISRHRSYQKLCPLIPLYFNSYLLYVTEFCFFKTYWNKIDADYIDSLTNNILSYLLTLLINSFKTERVTNIPMHHGYALRYLQVISLT